MYARVLNFFVVLLAFDKRPDIRMEFNNNCEPKKNNIHVQVIQLDAPYPLI